MIESAPTCCSLNVKTSSDMWKSENWREGTGTPVTHVLTHTHASVNTRHTAETTLIIGHLLWRLTGCLTTQNRLAEFGIISKLFSSRRFVPTCFCETMSTLSQDASGGSSRPQLSSILLHFAVWRLSAFVGINCMFCSLDEFDSGKNQRTFY